MCITWIGTKRVREVYCYPRTIGDALALVRLLNEQSGVDAQIDYIP